ncbi:MAG: PAS-domain containing protein, partial [Xanthobacteraceae bacterium]|nr:PAS-domain containing protein [Xanthobacteraceae bacterium]
MRAAGVLPMWRRVSRAIGQDDTRISASRALTIPAWFNRISPCLSRAVVGHLLFRTGSARSSNMSGRGTTKTSPKERKPRAAKPTRREQQLEFAINNVSQGVCMYDADAKLILCNQRYIDMYALSPDVA